MKPVIRKTTPFSGYIPGFFDEFFGDYELPSVTRPHVPSVNVKESDTAYELEIMAPGMEKDQFNIEVENDTLVISGSVNKEENESTSRYTRKEFTYQSFKRSFKLPENKINAEQIEAKYDGGILRLVLPKKAEDALPAARKIMIS